MSIKPSALFRSPTRYLVEGEPPEGFRNVYADALTANAFREPLSPTAREQCIGWCHVASPLGVTFDDINHWLFNQYAVFALRVEEKRVPPSILNPAVEEGVAAWLRERGRERAPAAVKKEIRETVEAGLLVRTLPRRQTYGVVWNISEGWVTFAGTSVSRQDAFRKLFHRTFGLALVPADPLDAAEDAPRLAACGAVNLVEGTAAPNEAPDDDEDMPCPPHIAADFMLWLAWRSEEGRAIETDGGQVLHWLDGRLEFRAPGAEQSCASVTDESPVNAVALGALADGKVLRSVPLVVRRGDREYRVTLTGSDLARRGAKLPVLVKGGELAEQVYEAAFLYEELEFCLSALFREFSRQRVGWGTQGVQAIRRWLGVATEQAFRFDAKGQGWLFGGAGA